MLLRRPRVLLYKTHEVLIESVGQLERTIFVVWSDTDKGVYE